MVKLSTGVFPLRARDCYALKNRVPDKFDVIESNVLKLYEKLDNTKTKDGCFSSLINKIRNGEHACKNAIENYMQGNINLKKANRSLNLYSDLQKMSLGLISSTATLFTSSKAAMCIAAMGESTSTATICTAGAITGAIINSLS